MIRNTCITVISSFAAISCASATQPFAGAPATRLTPAPVITADINSKMDKWQTVVYANRRPGADVIFYGIADWRDAIAQAKAAGAKQVSLIFVFDGPALVLALNDAATSFTATLAWIFLAVRVVYLPLYLLGAAPWRSLCWGVGFFASLGIAAAAAF